jgi:magnesium-dependent phosphatase 1
MSVLSLLVSKSKSLSFRNIFRLFSSSSVITEVCPELKVLPNLVVFDLDHCLWYPEMYTLDEMPSVKMYGKLGDEGEGVIGTLSGHEEIQLYPGALQVLQEYYVGKYPGMRIAAASSADTPQAVKIGKAALDILEVVPGVTVKQVFDKGWEPGFEGHMQIGRTPPLSANKALSHFPIIKEATKIAYNQMLFFDDCLWGDHCRNVAEKCPGVVTMKTPYGLRYNDWINGLKAYSRKYEQ